MNFVIGQLSKMLKISNIINIKIEKNHMNTVCIWTLFVKYFWYLKDHKAHKINRTCFKMDVLLLHASCILNTKISLYKYMIYSFLLFFCYLNIYDSIFIFLIMSKILQYQIILCTFLQAMKRNKLLIILQKHMRWKYIDHMLIFVNGKVLCNEVLSIKRSSFRRDLLWSATCITYQCKNTISYKGTNVKLH